MPLPPNRSGGVRGQTNNGTTRHAEPVVHAVHATGAFVPKVGGKRCAAGIRQQRGGDNRAVANDAGQHQPREIWRARSLVGENAAEVLEVGKIRVEQLRAAAFPVLKQVEAGRPRRQVRVFDPVGPAFGFHAVEQADGALHVVARVGGEDEVRSHPLTETFQERVVTVCVAVVVFGSVVGTGTVVVQVGQEFRGRKRFLVRRVKGNSMSAGTTSRRTELVREVIEDDIGGCAPVSVGGTLGSAPSRVCWGGQRQNCRASRRGCRRRRLPTVLR